MKRIPALKSKLLASGMVTMLLAIATLTPVARADDAVMHTTGGVSYVSGGVGADSIDRLSAMSKNFNLKLVFALNSGDYVSGVGVTISDAAGKSLLNTTSEGPWLLTRLPAGNYQIVATFSGTAVTRRATVGAARLSTVDMRWASE